MSVSHSDCHADGKNHSVCVGALSALTDEDVEVQLASLADWAIRDGRLERTFHCRTFLESIGLVNELARISEDLNHHPNFCVADKRRVSVFIWTHKMNCLTNLDFDLARSITAAYDNLSVSVTS
jgi:4a-hydroxytetrahydrobiopterin dehydratase